MALVEGAFSIGSHYSGSIPFVDTLDVLPRQAWLATLINGLVTSMLAGGWTAEGWSASGSLLQWQQSTISTTPTVGAYRALTHTDGATLFIGGLFFTGITQELGVDAYFMNDADNNDRRLSSNWRNPILIISYAPPTVSAANAGISTSINPKLTVNWFTDPKMFKWIALDHSDVGNVSSGFPLHFYWGVQDDSFWFTRRWSSSGLSGFGSLAVGGKVIIPISPTDNTAISDYALISLGSQQPILSSTRNTAQTRVQCYDLAGNRVDMGTSFDPYGVESGYNTDPPWLCTPIRVTGGNVNSYRIGSNHKGTIDPAILSYCSPQVLPRRRLQDGNRVHILNGIVLGYNPSSPDWEN
jgi:hypothetical protein